MKMRRLGVTALSLTICLCTAVAAIADTGQQVAGSNHRKAAPVMDSVELTVVSSNSASPGAPRGTPFDCNPAGPDFITQSTDPNTFDADTVLCGAAGGDNNGFARCFSAADFSNSTFTLDCIDIGVEFNNGEPDGPGGAIQVAVTIVPDCTGITALTAGQAPTVIQDVTLPALPGFLFVDLVPDLLIPSGSGIIVEFIDSGVAATVGIGNNENGETCGAAGDCSFVVAPGCGIATYTALSGIGGGFSECYLIHLTGTLGAVNGACCDDNTGICTAPVAAASCVCPDCRFIAGGVCAPDPFVPPCGTIAPNNNCDTKIALNQQCESVSFDNTIAGTSTTPADTCTDNTGATVDIVHNDLWYEYTVPALGTFGDLVVSTIGSDFNTALMVYGPLSGNQAQDCSDIDTGIVVAAACSDDIGNGNPLSYLTVSVSPGQIYKIRVGGSTALDDSTNGVLNIDYVPNNTNPPFFPFRRCCMLDGTCTLVPENDCEAAGGFWDSQTSFYEGVDPGAGLFEFGALGCKTLPCKPVGENCWNPIDLENWYGGPEGTRSRISSCKTYYKYQLAPGETIVLDTCGSAFDTVLEVYNTIGNPFGVSNGDCDSLVAVNDDCISGDPDDTAIGASQVASCFAASGEVDSCLCVSFDDTTDGNIIICVGAFNPDRDTSNVASINPQNNPLGVGSLHTITATLEPLGCFVCEVENEVDGGAVTPILEAETPCFDGGTGRTNDGCSYGATPLFEAVPAPTSGNPTYIRGQVGVYVDADEGQRSDEDWFEFTLTERKQITLRVVEAEFLAGFQLLRAGDLDNCLTTGFINATTVLCEDLSITVDACPGTYYAAIEALPPAKPQCNDSTEYLLCISCDPAPAPNCCPGDFTNDGEVEGDDIQAFVDNHLNPPPPVFPDLDTPQLGPCYNPNWCRADADQDGDLDMDDVTAFVTLLLNKDACTPKALCDDANRCQFPNGATANTSDANATVDFKVADNFIATQTGNITEVCWHGIYNDFVAGALCGATPPTDDFTITYYNDDGSGCPGGQIGSFNVGAATRNGPNPGFGGESYQYEATHAAVAVVEGTCYWVEIVNNTTGDCVWLWEESDTGDGIAVQNVASGGAYVCPTDVIAADLSFCFDINIGNSGCSTAGDPLGQCCFEVSGNPIPQCVETTVDRCVVIYNGYSFDSTSTCADCCPVPACSVECQPGDILEAEGCGFDKNGGCNSDPVAFELLNNGVQFFCGTDFPTAICGESFSTFSTGGTRDTDWYQLTAGDAGDYTFGLVADTTLDMFVIDAPSPGGVDCAAPAVLNSVTSAGTCGAAEFTIPLLAGQTVVIFVGGSQTDDHGCVNYRVEIDCAVPVACDVDLTGATPEAEACGADSNGGCLVMPEVFEPLTGLTCGGGPITFSGEAFATGAAADLDWWGPLVLAADSEITITLESEIPMLVAATDITGGCVAAVDEEFVDSDDCISETNTICLTAGTWVLVAAPGSLPFTQIFDGFPCVPGDNDYIMTVECSTPCGAGGGGPTCSLAAANCQSPDLASGFLSDEDQGITRLGDIGSAGAGSITQICWWGFEDDSLTPGNQDCTSTDDFTVTYYADDGNGSPDLNTVLGTFSQSGGSLMNFSKAAEPAAGGGGSTVFVYEADHAGVAIGAGECIWVEIAQSHLDCYCDWRWMIAELGAGNGRNAFNIDGTITLDDVEDMAFCVDITLDPTQCPVLGACCDVSTGTCLGDFDETTCLAQPGTPQWNVFQSCATFTCSLIGGATPPADTCADAESGLAVITCGESIQFNISDLPLTDDGPPSSTCEFAAGGPFTHDASGWWLFTATATTATISMCGLDDTEDSVMTLFSATAVCAGQPGPGTSSPDELFCDDDFCTAPAFGTPEISATGLTPGQTYLLNVNFYAGGHTDGPHQLTVTCP